MGLKVNITNVQQFLSKVRGGLFNTFYLQLSTCNHKVMKYELVSLGLCEQEQFIVKTVSYLFKEVQVSGALSEELNPGDALKSESEF